jgi:hypothetical protein
VWSKEDPPYIAGTILDDNEGGGDGLGGIGKSILVDRSFVPPTGLLNEGTQDRLFMMFLPPHLALTNVSM